MFVRNIASNIITYLLPSKHIRIMRVNMNTFADKIREHLNLENVFDTFPASFYPSTLQQTMRESEFILNILDIVKPRLIIEVGSWKGDSAALMASYLAERQIDGALICVDTWLGGIEHISCDDPKWGLKQFSKHGYPSLYFNFLANMVHKNVHRLVIPIPNTSLISGRYLKSKKISADLIYLDASHDEDDVYADAQAYWPLLKPGGIMLGDDWSARWHGVICAANRFAREKNLALQTAGEKWILQKP